MENGRRIAFDYGAVRIGVAMSDLSGLLASPHENFSSQSPELFSEIAIFIDEYQPLYIVVGNPRHLSGVASAKSESVLEFIAGLKQITNVPIYLLDERLTTVSGARELREAGVSSRAAKNHIDAAAAVTILESAMNQERLQGAPAKDLA
ncbi:MAG: Holliday junction resolvase RuvX [Actinobacteria bacterium]|uniref:Unannotated protein n=1 Tax=freshwater metagenome TaxID=449393 RepID=A0A6J6FIY1_9ZZZZ|nr:Holliday junction resolvase RuvX [Actinomycetota bacterium]